MAIAANKFRLLYLTRNKSDVEYKIMLLNQRRMALTDDAQRLAANYSQSVFQTSDRSDLYNGQTPGLLPGFIGWDSTVTPQPTTDPIPTGNMEQELAIIQMMDREIELQTKSLEVQHESANSEIESVKKVLTKNVEKDYKTFG